MTMSASPRDAAFAFAGAGDWNRVIPSAREAIAAEPEDAAAHALLALALAHTNESRQAVRAGRRAVALDPELPLAYHALGEALLEHDDVPGAEKAAREALRLQPDADAHALLAQCLVRRRRWRDALETAARGLQVDAEHAGCANLRAMALGNLGQTAVAEAVVDEALGIDPENASTHANRGWLLLRQSRHDEALESFRTALRFDPTFDAARAGIVEALKARNGVYRLILRYAFWMGSLDARTRWFILIGLFVGARTARALLRENPDYLPVLGPALAAYGLFAFATWLADPLSNLLLRLNPFGRLVLTKAEITASNLVGGCLATAVCSGALFAMTGTTAWLILAACAVVMLIPISGAFAAYETRAWRGLLGGLILLAATGAVAVVLSFLGIDAGVWAFIATLVGAFLFGWVANYVTIKFG